jgi:galactosyl transferase GMA12/MNN10 family
LDDLAHICTREFGGTNHEHDSASRNAAGSEYDRFPTIYHGEHPISNMKIALLTAFDESFREIADRTVPTMRRYADAFDLEFLSTSPESHGRPAPWSKITCIREVLRSGFDYCFWVDADAMFVRFDENIRDHLAASKDLYLCWHGPANSEAYQSVSGHFNTGVTVWRNSSWSLDFLDEIWRQTDFIDHPWWEQAALLNLIGYRSLLGNQQVDDPDLRHVAHIQQLSVNWNVLVGHTIAPDPIIVHFPGRSIARRLVDIDREISFQSRREMLSLNERHLLSRQSNLMSYQLKIAGDSANGKRQAEQGIAKQDGLLRSCVRLAKAWWRSVTQKVWG